MDNKQILREIGLTDSELRDYLKKLSGLYNRLTPKEQKVFSASMGSSFTKKALKSFQGEITAEQLEKFVRSREPKGAPVVFIVWACGHDENDKKQ